MTDNKTWWGYQRDKEEKDEEERPCIHDGCSQCHGTGTKKDDTTCVHFISCPCPKCTPRC